MEEQIIRMIINNKRRIFKLYKIVKGNIDMDCEMVYSESLLILEMISKINEEMTDIIYMILDYKNS